MVAKYAQKYKIVITFSITSMSRKMVLWLKTLKHLIIQVLILTLYKKSRQSFNVALNCILILGNYNWVSDSDFLDVGENWSQVWMYFTLLALWLSFLLITWDPLGRLKGAANVGEIFRSKITCWECFVIGVQRLFYLHLLNLAWDAMACHPLGFCYSLVTYSSVPFLTSIPHSNALEKIL